MPTLLKPKEQSKEQQLEELITKIRKLDEQEAKSSRALLDAAIKKGGLLVEAKQKVGHGGFMKWVDAQNFKFTHTTANTYMNLWKHRDEAELQNACNLTEAARYLKVKSIVAKLPMTEEQLDEWLDVIGKLSQFCPEAEMQLSQTLLEYANAKLKEFTDDATDGAETARAE